MTQQLCEIGTEYRGISNSAIKNIVSVGCAMQYAGISDIEFIKASFLVNIAAQMSYVILPQGQIEIQSNLAWLTIYYAKILQHFDREARKKLDPEDGKEYFASSSTFEMTLRDKSVVSEYGHVLVAMQDNIIVQNSQRFLIRPAFSHVIQVAQKIRYERQEML